MKKILSALMLGTFFAFGAPTSQTAEAADATFAPPPPPAPSYKWMIRARGIAVIPDEEADLSIPGSDVDISTTFVPEVDISYFFNEFFALELILATTPHDVDGEGSIAGLDMGEVWLLPPTLTAQLHLPITPNFKPYVGAGINYTIFFNEDSGDLGTIDYDNSFGLALQAGVDIFLDDRWGINFDVKKIWLSPDVTATTANGVRVTGEVDIDPWIVGGGVSYRF